MRITVLSFLLVACGPASLRGVIDGERVGGARDAFYDTLAIEVGPLSYEATVVVVTDFPDGCEVVDEFADIAGPGCDERCDAYLDVAETYGLDHDRYWSTYFYANTSEGVDGDFELDPSLGAGEFTVQFSTWDALPLQDAAACEEACEEGELLVAETDDGEEGELSLEQDDDLVRGKFDVGFGGEDGASGAFTARPCDLTVSIELF